MNMEDKQEQMIIIKKSVFLLGKILLGSLGFYAGMIFGSMLAGALALPVPPLPEGADLATLMKYQWVMSLIFACTLAFVSSNLNGGFLTRFLILFWLSWLTFSINTYLEARLFTTNGAAPIFTLVMQFMAVVLCSALMAWLFPPPGINKTAARQQLRAFVLQYRLSQWVWRLVLVWLAFPVCYVLFGRLAQPFIISFYEQQLAGLTAPGWAEILPVLFLRSFIFLLACVPILIFWRRSRLHLFFTLGSVLFILVGGLYMLQSYWYPPTMRIVHSIEILADSFIYAAAVVFLLLQKDESHEKDSSHQMSDYYSKPQWL